jgi:hypothetical protein
LSAENAWTEHDAGEDSPSALTTSVPSSSAIHEIVWLSVMRHILGG